MPWSVKIPPPESRRDLLRRIPLMILAVILIIACAIGMFTLIGSVSSN